MPAVCSALSSAQFARDAKVTCLRRTGPHQGANAVWEFRLGGHQPLGDLEANPAKEKMSVDDAADYLRCTVEQVNWLLENGKIDAFPGSGGKDVSTASVEKFLRSTAYHEAGHTLLNHLLDRGVAEVSILPLDSKKEGRMGFSRCGERGQIDPMISVKDSEVRIRRHNSNISVKAGALAERRGVGSFDERGAETDNRRFRHQRDALYAYSPFDLERYATYCESKCEAYLEDYQEALRELANLLIEVRHLTGEEAVACISEHLTEDAVVQREPLPDWLKIRE